MLFYVRCHHTADNCPGFHPEIIGPMMERLARRDDIAKECGVRLHGYWSALPEHSEMMIAEADTAAAVAMFLSKLFEGVEQEDIEMTAITPADELLELGRRMQPG